MDTTRLFVNINKFEPIQKHSSLYMMVENFDKLKMNEKVLSKRVQFLGSDDVWWISIEKVYHCTAAIELTAFLQTSDYRKPGDWCYTVTGTVSGESICSVTKNIDAIKNQMAYKTTISVNHEQQCLELELKMSISTTDNSETIKLEKFLDTTVQHKKIVTNNKSLLSDSKHSDFTFIVRGKRFNVHKCVLAAASPVFDKVFGTKFSENFTNEYHVNDIDPIIFQHLLNFIYCAELPENFDEVLRELFKAAHYYQISELVEICAGVEHYNLTKDNAIDVFEWADTYNLENVKLDAWRVIQYDILEILDEGPVPPPHAIRSLVANKIEKEKLLKEYHLKLSKLEANSQNLLNEKLKFKESCKRTRKMN